MKKFFACIFITAFFYSCHRHEETAASLLEKVKQNYETKNVVSYNVYLKMKFFDYHDTTRITAACALRRDKKDTIFGGALWIRSSDSSERFYNGVHNYLIEHNQKRVIRYKSQDNFIFTGNVVGNAIRIGFLNPENLTKDLNDSTIRYDVDHQDKHYIITVKYPDEAEFSNAEKKLWINEESKIIDRIQYRINMKDQSQFNEWNIYNVEFGKADFSSIDRSVQQYCSAYSLDEYREPTADDYKTLVLGSSAPEFMAQDFSSGKNVKLKDYYGKVTLLDFSYMSCYPCIKSIPHLAALQNEFIDKLHVLAINSKDNSIQGKIKMKEFIERNAVNYPVLLTDPKTDSLYKVRAYPTVYLLDKKGKIIFAQVGYNETLGDTLRQLIK